MSAATQCSIADFCETGSGGTPSRSNAQYYGGNIPWVKSGELRESVILDTEEKITELGLKESSAKLVPRGSILLAMYGATVGRMAILGVDAATNQAICNIRPDPLRADPQYVFHALQSKLGYFLAHAAGGAQPNISQNIIRETKIHLPPLDEQRRIAAILDKAEALRRKRKLILGLIGNLTQAVFSEIFGEMLGKESLRYQTEPFGNLAKAQQIGLVRSAVELKADAPTPYLRMDAITIDGRLDLTGIKHTHVSERELTEYQLKAGDFLFNTRNSKELVGKTAIYYGPPGCVYNNNILRVRFSSTVLADYVAAFFKTPYAKSELEVRKSGTTSVFAIYQKNLDTLPVVVPPIALQRKYVLAVSRINEMQRRSSHVQSTLEELFSSLQYRAFSGQL